MKKIYFSFVILLSALVIGCSMPSANVNAIENSNSVSETVESANQNSNEEEETQQTSEEQTGGGNTNSGSSNQTRTEETVSNTTPYWIHKYSVNPSSAMDYSVRIDAYFVSEGNGTYQIWIEGKDPIRFNSVTLEEEYNSFDLYFDSTYVGSFQKLGNEWGFFVIGSGDSTIYYFDPRINSNLRPDMARFGCIGIDYNSSVENDTTTENFDNIFVHCYHGFDYDLTTAFDIIIVSEGNGCGQIWFNKEGFTKYVRFDSVSTSSDYVYRLSLDGTQNSVYGYADFYPTNDEWSFVYHNSYTAGYSDSNKNMSRDLALLGFEVR